MTFAQALARIEELKSDGGGYSSKLIAQAELNELLHDHADSIVQLAKIAAGMRAEIEVTQLNTTGYNSKPHGSAHSYKAGETAEAYDKLMKGEDV